MQRTSYFLFICLGAVSGVLLPFQKQMKDVLPLAPIIRHNNNLEAIVCPGGGSECPQFATCCKMASGEWGCCPFPEAVCCTDGIHCCPKNSQCDLAQQRCVGNTVIPWASKFEASNVNPTLGTSFGSVTCPDKQSECPDQTTCCQLTSGDWGCCPFEGAVCCSDHLHCCPKDTVCNIEEGRCQRHSALSLLQNTEQRNRQNFAEMGSFSDGHSESWSENICPDHYVCQDKATCCQLKSGKYGCCPFKKADCCEDGLHCCAEGYKCDTKGGRCVKN